MIGKICFNLFRSLTHVFNFSHSFSVGHGGIHARNTIFIHVKVQLNDQSQTHHDVTLTMLPNHYFGELRAEILFSVWSLAEKRPRGDHKKALEDVYNFAQKQGKNSVVE